MLFYIHSRQANDTCSGCNEAKYCGSFCQHKDWEIHHRRCGRSQLRGSREASLEAEERNEDEHPTTNQRIDTTTTNQRKDRLSVNRKRELIDAVDAECDGVEMNAINVEMNVDGNEEKN